MRAANPVGPGLQQGPGLNGIPSRQGTDANWNRRYWVGSARIFNGTGLRCPGDTVNARGNCATTAYNAVLSPTGDFELVVKVTAATWTPTTERIIAISGTEAIESATCFILRSTTGGSIRLTVPTGATGRTFTSVAMPAPTGTPIWIKATFDQNNGSAQSEVNFYLSDDGSTWTQLGTALTSANTGAGNNVAGGLTFGNGYSGASGFTGRIHRAILRSSIGGPSVFDADFDAQATGTSSFADSVGARTVTITSASMPWSSLGGWSEQSGGIGGASIPTAATEVILDEFSPTLIFANSYTATCGAFDASRFSGTMAMDYANMNLTVRMGAVPNPRFVLSSAMTFGATTAVGVRLQFDGSGPVEGWINTAGKNMPGTIFSGGPWRLESNYATNNANVAIFLNAGGWLKTNGYRVGTQAVPWVTTLGGTSSVRRLELGSSTWYSSGWSAGTANLLLDPGTSTINVIGQSAGFAAYAGQRYNIVTFPTLAGSSTASSGLSNGGTGTIYIEHLIVRNVSTTTFSGTTTAMPNWFFAGPNANAWQITDLTVEGQLGAPVLFTSTAGVNFNVTNAPTLSNVTFLNTQGAGTIPWTGTRLGDAGGNTNITFPASQTNYWVPSTPGLTGSGLYCGTWNTTNVAGTYASTPDAAPLDITGDIDVRVKFAGRICRETSGNQFLLCKGNTPGGALRAYKLYISYLGVPLFGASLNGTTDNVVSATQAVWPLSNYTAGWLRATRVAATGVVTFYTSPDGSTWTQLGNAVAGSAGSIFNSPSPLWVGVGEGATAPTFQNPFDGTLYRAQVYDGIDGTLAFDANFETAPAAAASFTESSVNAATVTITSSPGTGFGAWTDAAHWASTSGGTGGTGRVPLAHDDVVVDGNSGSGRIQVDAADLGRNVNGTGASVGTLDMFPRWMAGGATLRTRCWGSWTSGNLVATTSTTGACSLEFAGQGSTFTHSIGSTFGWGDISTSIVGGFIFDMWGSTTHRLGSDLNTTYQVNLRNDLGTAGGTFDANGYNVTAWAFTEALTTQVRTVNFGTGTWTLTGTSGTVLTIPNQANLTLSGSPTWVVAETLDAIVKNGRWRVPQYGSVATNTTRATNYIAADSTNGSNSWQTPRPAAALTDDLDIIVRFNRDFNTQSVVSLVNTANSVPSPGVSFALNILTNTPNLSLSTNGTMMSAAVCTTTLPFGNGVTGWLRVTRNKAAGQVKFYTCVDQVAVPTGGEWVQLGTTVSGVTTSSLYAGKTDLAVGSYAGYRLPGISIYHAQVSNVIDGTPVATLDFTSMDDYALSTVDAYGNTWRSYQYASRTNRRVVGGVATSMAPAAGNVWATPDSAALSITSDIDIAVRVLLYDWTPTATHDFVLKYATSNLSFYFQMLTTGRLNFGKVNGVTDTQYQSTAGPATSGLVSDGGALWLRMTWDQTNGAVSTATFYTAPDSPTEPTVWTPLGTPVTSAVVTSINDTAAPLEIGGYSAGLRSINGNLYRAIVKNGIGGTTVFDADFSNLQDDTYAFRESSANSAFVWQSADGTSGIPAGRTAKNISVTNKTLPGSSFTVEPGGGGVLAFTGSVAAGTHSFPALVSVGGKWFAGVASSGGTHVFPSITWTTTATGPRNASIRPATLLTKWSSGGVVTVNYADVLYNDADGASIPFYNTNGLNYGTTDWSDEDIYPDFIILGTQ